jgi:DNA repair exonuclease SbcCD nuclease subunit
MISFITMADIHMADRNPSSRIDDYPAAIKNKLQQVGMLTSKIGADFVLCSGDWFHSKSANRTSHETTAWMIRELLSWKVPIISIVGSHDFPWSNLYRIKRQPIGVLANSGAITLVDSRGEREDDPLFQKDWTFEKGGISVRVVGLNDDGRISLNDFSALPTYQRGEETYLISMAHTFASLKGGSFFDNPVLSYRDLAQLCDVDVHLFGHWHRDQGVEEVDGKYFINVGALSRGAYNDENIDRHPKVTICRLDGHTTKITPVRLKVSPASEVFDMEKKEALKEKEQRMNSFIKELSSTFQEEEEGVSLDIDSLQIDKETRDMVNSYLEMARQ